MRIQLFFVLLSLLSTTTSAKTYCNNTSCLVLPSEAPEVDLLSRESSVKQVESLLQITDLQPDEWMSDEINGSIQKSPSNWQTIAKIKSMRELELLTFRSLEFYRIQYQWKSPIISDSKGFGAAAKFRRKL